MYAKVLKDSAASSKAWASRRSNTETNTKETYKLLQRQAGLRPLSKGPKSAATKTDTNHIGSVAAALGIL